LILPYFRQEVETIEIEDIIREARRLFAQAGIPVFDNVKNALRAIVTVASHYDRRFTSG